MPKKQREPMTIEEMVERSKGGKRKSEYSEEEKPKKDKKKNPTKDLSIGGAIRNLRNRKKKNESTE